MLIFISHSSRDDHFVNDLSARLSRRGYTTWVDHQDIPAGKVWDDVVEDALHRSDAMILVLSPEAVESREVKVEWGEFRTHDKLIVPVMIRESRLPLRLRDLHYLDFSGGESIDDEAFTRLVKSLPALPEDTQPIRAQVTQALTSDADVEIALVRQQLLALRSTFEAIVGDDQMLMVFPKQRKTRVFDLDREKLFLGWHDRASGIRPDIDLTPYEAVSFGVSRQHALLSKTRDGLTITDLDSRNGTYINQRRLSPQQPVLLKNEMIIRLGLLPMQVFFKEPNGPTTG
jgi:hypothetical protein